MDDIEAKMEEYELLSRFPRNSVGEALGALVIAEWRACRDETEREKVRKKANAAAGYADHVFYTNAFTRSGDMAEWFGLPEAGLDEIERRHRILWEQWHPPVLDKAEQERLDAEEEAAEAEQERLDRLEEEGAYGRTLPYDAKCDDWIFIRFGGMPKEGRSVFGLAREDTEDGPDPWRMELGGMTHEAGVSVFRAYRHPDVRDAYVLIAPAFYLARYNVSDQVSHLLSVIPDPEDGKDINPVRIDGCLKTCLAFDCTLRADLGSDGEYLVDSFKPYTATELPLSAVWVSERENVKDFLTRYRRTTFDDEGVGCMALR